MNETTLLANRLLKLPYCAGHCHLSQALSFIMLWERGGGISLPNMLNTATHPVVMYQLTAEL